MSTTEALNHDSHEDEKHTNGELHDTMIVSVRALCPNLREMGTEELQGDGVHPCSDHNSTNGRGRRKSERFKLRRFQS
jgi:hypothetical protein